MKRKKKTPKVIEMVCPKCKREVKVEMGEDKLGKDLLCKECGKHCCTPAALKKAPRLKPKNAKDKAVMERFRHCPHRCLIKRCRRCGARWVVRKI